MSLRKSYLIVILGVLGATACSTSSSEGDAQSEKMSTDGSETTIRDEAGNPILIKSKRTKARLEKYPAQEQ